MGTPRSASWDAAAARYRWQEPLESTGLDRLIRLLPVPGDGVVLDLGAGPGTLTRRLRAALPGHAVLAVERSRAMVAVGRYGGAAVVRGDVTALPLPAGTAAAVTAAWVLHVLEPPERAAALAECARVLRPDGHLGLVVPAAVRDPVRRGVRAATRAALRRTGSSGVLAVPRDLDGLLVAAGFEVVADVTTGRGYWARVMVARRSARHAAGCGSHDTSARRPANRP
ncbi:MAG: class I SAM-dependent methyltransferase [Kineosporiaceae bacterium]